MKTKLTLGLLALLFAAPCICYSQYPTAIYRPFGINSVSSYARWNLLRQAVSAPTTQGSHRPVMLGVTGHNLELLQDAIARKYSHVTHGGSLSIARHILADTTASSFPKIRGAMAEAIFLDAHPEWRYVAKPNAPQHDVYAKMPSGGPGIQTGQVKFHISGQASLYAHDMIADYRSGNFFVPDDHVEQLKTYLKEEAERLRAEGDNYGATNRYRDVNRVKGIGATSSQIDKATQQAIAEARLVRVAPYVFIGVATSLLLFPTAWDWYQDDIDNKEAVRQLMRGGSTVASAIIADQTLKQWRGGILRGTIRGNVIFACVALIVDTSWQTYEYGGLNSAVQNPEFVIYLGGNISGFAGGIAGAYAGMIGGSRVGKSIGIILGPKGSRIGNLIGGAGGIVIGSITGVASYFSGLFGTRWVMKTFRPEKLYEQERSCTNNIRGNIKKNIMTLQAI